jgi:POT family proton-dependent oligopeptide transporter
MAQERIDAGETPHISWQIAAYLVLTAAEVMVSITALEFSYTQAPRTMKSFVMGLYLLFGIAFGNWFASAVNGYIAEREKAGRPILEGAAYFWFFTAAMVTMAIIFAVYASFYRGQTYIQGEEAPAH